MSSLCSWAALASRSSASTGSQPALARSVLVRLRTCAAGPPAGGAAGLSGVDWAGGFAGADVRVGADLDSDFCAVGVLEAFGLRDALGDDEDEGDEGDEGEEDEEGDAEDAAADGSDVVAPGSRE